MRYNNYHKHCHYSNIRTLDCIVKPQDYIDRAKELNHTTVFTTQHGWGGNYLEMYDLCQKNNLKMIFGAELYIVADRLEKDNSNNHIIIIGKNQDAFYQLNELMSESNKTGFYYKPRIDLSLLLSLNPNNFIITSACVAGILRDEDTQNIFLEPIIKHFRNNFYLETQAHSHKIQVEHNLNIINLSNEYKVQIIHANDSHYIYPEQKYDRDLFLRGKGLRYEDEDGFILDYPNYETIVERYKQQNVLTNSQIQEAVINTLIFDKCEDLVFTKEIKMPTIYPNEDSNKKLKSIIVEKWNKEKKNIDPKRHKEYQNGIASEFNTIKNTNMADYFLLNERIIDRAVNVYNGILTRTGRGSAVSFYVNKLLGFTEIDRFESEVPLYPSRFMTVSRIMESKSLPDIDFNWANVDAPIKASKDILGEDNVYYMYAIGTMKESSAFRNLCRAYDMSMDTYNEVGKDVEKYAKDPQWKDLIEESKKFIGVIDSISPSPCSFIMLNKPISKELGLLRVGDQICACIDGYTSDVWKYLKNDFLTVKVWKIVSDTFKLLDKPIPNIRELKKLLNNKVWDLYKNGLTATLNQVDTDLSTTFVKRYSPINVAEISGFVAAIRPGFASLVNTFLERKEYSTGVKEIDDILEPSYHFMLYQESIMAFLVWCGLKEDHTYDIIKKIAKKKFKEEEIAELKSELIAGFIKNVGNDEQFEEVWQVVQDAAKYSFNASHSLSVAWDSLYGGYLKANYPLEYYTVILNEYDSNTEKTSKILNELPYFNIKLSDIEFGNSIDTYTFNKKTNTIYKSLTSIKFLNGQVARELYELAQQKEYTNFIDLLEDIKTTSINSRQLKILTGLDFFKKFGKNKKLLQIIEIYDNFALRKQINFKDIMKLNINEEMLKKYSNKTTETLYKELDMKGYIREVIQTIEDKPMSIKDQVKFEMDYLEYVKYINTGAGDSFYIVIKFETYKDKSKPYVTIRQINNGKEMKTKIKDGKIFIENPFKIYDVLKVNEFKTQFKTKNMGGKWMKSDELEEILIDYDVY
jgi:DNA polymerase III alpha subunit